MTKQLSPGELAVGMLVTVLQNKPHTKELVSPLGDSVLTETIPDNSGIGAVHTVLAVDLPFVVIRRESRYEHERFPLQADTRRTVFMEVTREYAVALCPNLQPPAQPSPRAD